MNALFRLTVLFAAGLLLMAHVSAQMRTGQAGDPLSGVTPQEFEEFRVGLEDFRSIEEPEP